MACTELDGNVGDVQGDWSLPKRILFRFVFVYLAVYGLCGGNMTLGEDVWGALLPRVSRWVFGLELPANQLSGSGDQLSRYMQVFCILAFAAASALLWTAVDRRSRGHERLHEWLRVYLRYLLAVWMIFYGAAKVIPSQFPAPSASRLVQPFGAASPMGLLWTFMGASPAYTMFTGAAEMLCGALLTARRTTLLGALLAMGVMSNVVMLNLCYDVPVKLFSVHLLLMACVLVAPDLARLVNLFVLDRPVKPADLRPRFQRRWVEYGALALRNIFFGLVAYGALLSSCAGLSSGDRPPPDAVRGLWAVQSPESVDAASGHPSPSTQGWRRLVIQDAQFLELLLEDDRQEFYLMSVDERTRTLTLSVSREPRPRGTLSYSVPGPDALALDGTFNGWTLHARLRRIDEKSFPLVNRGFHWVNAFPFNR